MPSPRRLRLLTLAAVATVIVLFFYTTPFSHDFYHKTVRAMDHTPIHNNPRPPAEAAVDAHMRKDAHTLPADRDADGDVDADDARLADQLQERLKAAELAAKDSANEKGLRPDHPEQVIGIGNSAAGQKGLKPEDEKPAAPAAPPAAAVPAEEPAAEKPAAVAKPEPVKEELSEKEKAEKTLAAILKESPVIIFSKSYCPHSKRAKGLLLDKYHITPAPHVVELDEHPQGSALQDALEQKTGRRTVPNIMIHGVSVGGADSIVALDEERKLVAKFVELGKQEVKITERL